MPSFSCPVKIAVLHPKSLIKRNLQLILWSQNGIMSLKWLICVKVVCLTLFSLVASAQDNMPEAISRQNETARIKLALVNTEIEVAEREVHEYDKQIKDNKRIEERSKDRVDRLKYKVMREISDMDTTRPHNMTYNEWRLEKAERERAHARGQLAKAQKSREEKILYLGEKTREREMARTELARSAVAQKNSNDRHLDPNNKSPRKKRTRVPRDYKGEDLSR